MKLPGLLTIGALILSVGGILYCLKAENTLANTRSIRLELSHFPGSLFASYTCTDGGTVNEPVNSMPRTNIKICNRELTAVVMAVSGNGNVQGQRVIILVKRGTATGSGTVAMAESTGSCTLSAPVIRF